MRFIKSAPVASADESRRVLAGNARRAVAARQAIGILLSYQAY